jgi:predicted enzyme related to lactoylglutathione lyase
MKIIKHFIPVFVNDLEQTVKYYERLVGKPSDRQWEIPEAGFKLATVEPYVIVSGSDEALEPAKTLRSVVYVDSIEELKAFLSKEGTSIIRDQHGPVGPSLFVEHSDGAFIEYVEPNNK